MAVGNKPITILHYEDTPDYAQGFKASAQDERILVKTINNVTDLLEELENNPRKYKYVVLDARAFRHEDQVAGTESEIYLIKIFDGLTQIRRKHNVLLPCCINTGFADLKLKLADTVDCPVYDKGNEVQLFADIWDSYNSTEDAKIRNSFPEVFEWADKHFDEADLVLLSSLFANGQYKSLDIADRVNNLATLRRVAEHVMDKLYAGYLNNAPGVFKTQSGRLREIADYINGNNDMPVHVYGTITNIRKTAAAYGSHTPSTPQEIKEYPSGDYIAGLAMSLKDVFTWARTKLN